MKIGTKYNHLKWKGNIIEKKKPGLHDSPEYFAYDNMNRLISFRDGNLVDKNQRIDKEYDSLGRETKSYLSSTLTPNAPNYAPSANGGTPPIEMSNSNPRDSLTQNFYDGIFPADFPEELAYVADDYYGTIAASSKGQLTGTKVYMPGGNICEYTAMYYDKKGRLIQQKKTNFYAGNEDFYFRYNFVGELLETKHVLHPKNNFPGYTEKIVNLLDYRGRVLEVSHQLNNDMPIVVANYAYDELGKLKGKTMFPNNQNIANRTINYSYHIQGMLKATQSPLFTETLIYGGNNGISLSNFVPSYNGNISAKKTVALLMPDATALNTMTETYKYDQLDRLTNAYHSGNNGSNFSVKNITYDLQGNILSLTRYGLTNTLTAAVTEREYGVVNQIVNTQKGHVVEETQNENSLWPTYGSQTYLPNGTFDDNCFDYNGNTIYDDARETEFTYNHLNLATKICNPSDTMYIQYDAAGNKIRQISGGDTLYFVGSAIYKNSQLSYLSLPEGYYSDGQYFSVIHDYLGSVRLVLDANGNNVQEVNHYGPWGVEYGLSDEPFGVQPFKHQGKERMDITGFSLHNHGARFADNVMGRWTTRDPLEEKDYWNGAYVYCGNNPVRYIDPDGKYFKGANKRRAARIERKAERRIAKLEKTANKLANAGKSIGDLLQRATELKNSTKDIQSMRGDQTTEYRYGRASKKGHPVTEATGTNKKGDQVITMFTEQNMGSKLHESRHGGQHFRNEYNINTGANYGVADEVSAYKAQYAWSGKFTFIDTNKNPSEIDILNASQAGSNPFATTINSIHLIVPSLVNSLVDPGFVPIYPPTDIPLDVWNAN
jgi:RHS repeat-associated protein